jgi:DNA primase
VLFGLNYSRKTIAKEKRALIVEGQVDALKLIDAGFNWTVAGQGTAFTEDAVKEVVALGVRQVYLAFDGDQAGQDAALKVGHLFQKQGAEVLIIPIQEGQDPDQILRELGPKAWEGLLGKTVDYITFFVDRLSRAINVNSPAGKNELVQTIAKRIREWDHPLMVRESLKKLARLTQTPENLIDGLEGAIPQTYIKRTASVANTDIDPDRVLEADLLRWLFLMGDSNPELLALAEKNISLEHFRTNPARILYEKYKGAIQDGSPHDLLTLAINADGAEAQLFLAEILQKKVNQERAESCFVETIEKLLERRWMQKREEIRLKIYSGRCSEEEVLSLAKEFDQLKRERPQITR